MTEISAESDKQIRKSQHGRSVYSTVRPKENKQLVTVSEGEEELPEDNVFKEDLVERFTILEQYYEDNDEEPTRDMLEEDLNVLERSKSRKQKLIKLKDEELRDLRTELKQKEETYSATIKRFEKQIQNFQAKHDEGVKKIKELEDEKTILKEDVKKIKELEDENARLKERDVKGVKKIKELEDEIARLKEGVKKIKELEDEIGRLKEEARDEFEEGNEMVKAQMEKTEEVKREKARLEEEWERLMNCQVCFDKEKKILLLPCGHFCVCQECVLRCKRKCPICRKEITDHVKAFN